MIRNVSYNNKEIFSEIDQLAGKSFSFRQRLALGGTGSQRLIVSRCSDDIAGLLKLDTNLNYCNIELRIKGIIVRFRSILETFAWTIPYHQLNISNSAGACTISDGESFMDLVPAYKIPFDASFFNKLIKLKSGGTEQSKTTI